MIFSADILSKKYIRENFPVRSFFIILAIWIVLAAVNFASIYLGKYTGCDWFFPFSVLYPSNFLVTGFLFAFAFLALGMYAFKNSEKYSVTLILFICVLLVLLGNLAQGNPDIAFERPFYYKGLQYYSDAVKVTDPKVFLSRFTQNQDSYLMHTKTHPPFVVLLHYFILKIFGGNILALGIVFFLISVLFFPVFNLILKNLDFSLERRKEILLLSAVIPSINIYTLVSIDGIILMTSSLMILGIARIYKLGKIDIWSILLCVISLILTNMLSFSGLFLIAFFGLLSFVFLLKRNFKFAIVGIISVVAYLLFFVLIYRFFGYNQWETFRKASASENPRGFMLFSFPYIYFWTRIQDIIEILLFLSFGFTAILFGGKRYKEQLFNDKFINILFFCGISVLLLMFISGAYGTGETARACLFIVPFFLIILKNVNQKTFALLYILVLFQCFGMQMIGNFFW